MSAQATSWQSAAAPEQPRRQGRAQQRGDVAGVGELGQRSGAERQQRDEPRGEARLRRRAARVAPRRARPPRARPRSSAAGRPGRPRRRAAAGSPRRSCPTRRAPARGAGARAPPRCGRRARARGPPRAAPPDPPRATPPSAATASAPRTAWPPASASASARAAPGAARARSRAPALAPRAHEPPDAERAARRARGARDAARRRSQPPASSAPAPTSARRRRSGAVGVRPSRRSVLSGSSQRPMRARRRRLLDGRQRLPRAHHRQHPGEPGEHDGRRHAARRSARSSLSAARQRGRPARHAEQLARRGAAGDAHDLGHRDDPPACRRAAAPDGRRGPGRRRPARGSPRAAARRPAISASVSRRRSASSGEPAWTVDSEPSWPRRHRREHVQRLAAADLADDDAVGPHPQRVAHEVADRHLAATLDARRPRLQAHDVRLAQAQLGGVLDVTIRSPAGTNDDSALSVVVLPEPVPPLTRMLSAGAHRARQQVAQRRLPGPGGDQVVGAQPARAEAADRQHRPVERQRRDHDVDARAVGQPRVAQRLGLVDAAPERREDPLDRVAQLASPTRSARRSAPGGRARSTHTGAHGPLTITSSTAGSRSSGSSGPSPNERSATRATSVSRAPASSSAASRSTSARMRPSRSPAPRAPTRASSRSRSAAASASRSATGSTPPVARDRVELSPAPFRPATARVDRHGYQEASMPGPRRASRRPETVRT